ncbi:MAG: bifunctional 5,10-methylene-tetrahydrofolate dehydrogenase/5,10-methylene-tetrahydrofolate cyclohydrolase [Bacteroidales bacterium]|nr:bifunctional 5,10-methylene-tetrahydrofolate dehydrogenase/5,10-methylene-tetrahydrofolate cyclohydrolase [Bacteroidales bacterium]
MILINGKETATQLKKEIAKQVEDRIAAGKRQPHLVAILVGNNGASMTYVANKEKACAQVGFKSSVLTYEATISEDELIQEIQKLNQDPTVDGFIVQLPLPKHINEQRVIESIDPRKDVDGFHSVNVGNMTLGLPCFVSATPHGIMELLEAYQIDTKGKHCVILGRSNIVGRPMANLLSQKTYPGNCTVTVCHSLTPNIKEITLMADIIIAAIGVPEFLKADMVREGAVVIDVGITRIPADNEKGYRIVGDVAFDEVAPKCSYITPVPGGVGPMTIISLMKNTLRAAELNDTK